MNYHNLRRQVAERNERCRPDVLRRVLQEVQQKEMAALLHRQMFERLLNGVRGIDFCGCDDGCTNQPEYPSPYCLSHTRSGGNRDAG